jgi:spore coat protein CotH
MIPTKPFAARLALMLLLPVLSAIGVFSQVPDGPPPGGFGGPGGRGGFGGVQPERELVKDFDKDGDHRLNAAERKAARELLAKEAAEGRGLRRGFGGRPGGFGNGGEPTKPGPKVSPAEVKNFPASVPLYDSLTLRTLFLEFADADWEKAMEDFHKTDVLVPAKLTVDGRTYPEVGVHFRGMSSYGMVSAGQKRSLNLSLDYADEKQNLYGYRTLNLLNAHEDPIFMRPVLFYDIARQYLPAAKANFVKVVINGESWGVYVNVEQFNKDFIQEWFQTKKGARWKVPGSPNGRGSLAYLGDDAAPYKKIYEIKSKDNAKSWNDLIHLTKVLSETPADKLEAALEPILDVDGALRFLALDNALINNDGYWIRTSDYSIYEDEKGRFHILPQDANETFVKPGGPGFGGGGPGGRGGRGGFGPGMMLAPQLLAQGDKDGDQKLTKTEFTALAGAWFDKLDVGKTGKLNQEQFTSKLGDVLPTPQGGGGPGGPGGGRGGFGPAMFVGPALFTAADADKDGSITRTEWVAVFTRWSNEWDTDKSGSLNEEELGAGLNAALPRPNFGGMGGGPGGPGGPGGGRGPGGMGGMGGGLNIKGVELDPLQMANNPDKVLIAKLLAVPSLRTRYLAYVRDIAEKHLDWSKLGPIAEKYHALIADEVKADTRKLESTEDFLKGLTEDAKSGNGPGGGAIGLKNFADQRRAYLLKQTTSK